MRHAERCKFWKAPANEAEVQNSLHDAYMSLPHGMMLVYRMDRPGSVTNGPHPFNSIAGAVAARLGGALVQWPSEPAHGDQNKVRTWIYAIQKPTLAA